MKDELNRSYIGGGVVYVLKSELSRSSLQYQYFDGFAATVRLKWIATLCSRYTTTTPL